MRLNTFSSFLMQILEPIQRIVGVYTLYTLIFGSYNIMTLTISD